MPSKEVWREAEEIALEYLTGSRVVSNVPCLLYQVSLCATASADVTATVYDGSNIQGNIKVDIQAAAKTVADFRYEPPQLFTKGIYVTVGTNAKVMIRYATRKE